MKGLIACAQRVEHDEIAGCRTAASYAAGAREHAETLWTTDSGEKTNLILTELAASIDAAVMDARTPAPEGRPPRPARRKDRESGRLRSSTDADPVSAFGDSRRLKEP